MTNRLLLIVIAFVALLAGCLMVLIVRWSETG